MAEAFREHCVTEGRGRVLTTLVVGLHATVEAAAAGIRERFLLLFRRTGLRDRWPATSHTNSIRDHMTWFIKDIRFAFRSFRRTPVFTLTVLAVLALGIGATTAIFTVVDSLLIRGVPFENPDELVRIAETYQPEGGALERRAVSYPDFQDWRDQTTAFAELGISTVANVTLSEEGVEALRIGASFTSSAFFRMLHATPVAGRLLMDEDDVVTNRFVVLSHDFWRRRYQEDRGVVGRTITLNDISVTVVGIAREGYGGPFGGVDVWLPFLTQAAIMPNRPLRVLQDREARGFFVMGRLRPSVTIEEAQRQIDGVTAGLHDAGLVPMDRGALVVSFEEEFLAAAQRTSLLLFGAVGLVLLIACANVANLVLVRQMARAKEIALRQALGASRGDVARQLMVESLILGVTGGALGTVAAVWLTDLLAAGNVSNVPNYIQPGVNMTTMGFALVVSLGTGLLFGLLPAVVGTRVSLSESLKAASRSVLHTGGAGRFGVRRLLVVGQVAVAVLLLIGAGLMVKSIARQLAVDTGFEPAGVVVAQVDLPATRYDAPGRIEFARRLEQALVENPSVRRAAVASDIPLASGYRSASTVTLDDDAEFAGQEIRVYVHSFTPGYLETLGLSLVQGRNFTDRDAGDSPGVMMVSQQMARKYWPNESPVGKRVSGAEIVGVVGDATYRGLVLDPVNNPNDPDVFYPLLQRPAARLNVAVKGDGSTVGLADVVRAAVRRLDGSLPVYGVSTMDEVIENQVAASRAATRQLGAFAVIALVIAAAGLYGVMAYQVSRRAKEIGVRIALGAMRGRVMGMILGQGLALVGVGLALGLGAAAVVGRVLQSQLYDVATTDIATYGAVTLVFSAVAALACLIPATRAMRVDPVAALREE